MSYQTTIVSDESENEHFNKSVDMRPSYSKTKPTSQRANSSYRESISECLRTEDFDVEKFSEATVRLHVSDESKNQTLHTGLNEMMQSIFDKLLTDLKCQTIKNKATV
ncbi:hypothetical protein QTP88_003910 [Uroleucon formosanum]